jgi:hypothetical protein
MRKNNHLLYILFGLAVLTAIVTRFYKLGDAPAGFYVDEAGQGYSAYSILKTGKDEFGKSYPVIFRSLTDFKTPVYVYLIVPLIPLFDLTPFTVRFPSFLFSILTFPILYLLIKEMVNGKWLMVKGKQLSPNHYSLITNYLPLLASFLLAISPWHILFGRTNFECNVALFFFLTGVLAFYKGLKKPKVLLLSALMFAIAIPAYHSQRIITPLTMVILLMRHRKILLDKLHRPYLISGAIVGLVISIPTLYAATTPGFFARASGLNIFSHTRQMPDGFIAGYQGILTPIINGSWFLSTREFFSLYFSYFSPRHMFILGDYGGRSSFPELSTFFLWQFPFYLYGLWMLFKNKRLGELRFFVIMMLLISPIPAAVTRDPYTTIRALPLVIPQIIIIAMGITGILSKLNKLQKSHYMSFLLLMFIYSLLKLYSSVIILNEHYRARLWDWGWREVAEVIKDLKPNLPIVVDNTRADPELMIAFFLKYDPAKFQQENFEVSPEEYYSNLIRVREKRIGRVTTSGINWERDLIVDRYLIGDELAISPEQIERHRLDLVREIFYPDGTTAFRIVKTNPEWERKQRLTPDI